MRKNTPKPCLLRPDDIENLWGLLASDDSTNHALAFQLMKGAGMPAEIKQNLDEWRSFFHKTHKRPCSYRRVLEYLGEIRETARLSVMDLPLASLPTNYRLCPQVNRVILVKLKLRTLPPAIFDLPIISLDIAHTPTFRALPEDIGKCQTLEALTLYETAIHHLPESINDLPHLNYLFTIRTPLKSLPIGCGKINELTILQIEERKYKYCVSSKAVACETQATAKKLNRIGVSNPILQSE